MDNLRVVREPLFHIANRAQIPIWKAILIRVIAIILGLIVAGLIGLAIYNVSPFKVYYEIINGTFLLDGVFLTLVSETVFLLGVGIALIPVYKMKFWNLGGNGQILIGALCTLACMRTFGGKLPDGIVWILMVVFAMMGGALWAILPGICKAFFKTNESLFSLMMNYIAAELTFFVVFKWKGNLTTMLPIEVANLPVLGHKYVLPIIVVVLLTAFMYLYMNHSKHGYEIAVVGESENTARYVGINFKKVIIRTVAISGALCGLVGLLLVSVSSYKMDETLARNLGFTAILAVWFAKNNPLLTIVSAFGMSFLTLGMEQASSIAFRVQDVSIPTLIVGLIYFFVIGCEFFADYIIKRNGKQEKKTEKQTAKVKEDE